MVKTNEQNAISRRNELHKKAGLTREEQTELTKLDNLFWVNEAGPDGECHVGCVAKLRLIGQTGMRVEVTVIDKLLRLSFDDHFDDGSSAESFSPEQLERIVAFHKKHQS